MATGWRGSSPTPGTRRNQRIRKGGTWSAQTRRIYREQRQNYRREMGPTWRPWSARQRKLRQQMHAQQAPARRKAGAHRGYTVAAAVAVLAVLAALHQPALAVIAAAILVAVVTRRSKR